MYQLKDVTKTYRTSRTVTALDGVSLEVPDGQFLAIRGNTGGGKSTLLQMLGGLDRPDSGTVDFEGTDITRMSESQLTKFRAKDLGIVFQGFNL